MSKTRTTRPASNGSVNRIADMMSGPVAPVAPVAPTVNVHNDSANDSPAANPAARSAEFWESRIRAALPSMIRADAERAESVLSFGRDVLCYVRASLSESINSSVEDATVKVRGILETAGIVGSDTYDAHECRDMFAVYSLYAWTVNQTDAFDPGHAVAPNGTPIGVYRALKTMKTLDKSGEPSWLPELRVDKTTGPVMVPSKMRDGTTGPVPHTPGEFAVKAIRELFAVAKIRQIVKESKDRLRPTDEPSKNARFISAFQSLISKTFGDSAPKTPQGLADKLADLALIPRVKIGD